MTFARGAKVKDGIEFHAADIPDLSGVLLPNLAKRGSGGPDYLGSVLIEGYAWQLRAWNRKGAAGEPYIKIRCMRRHT